MATGKADEAWQALNARQRMYLSAIYDADQAAEGDIRTRSARWEKTPPADEWRMLLYDLKLPKDILGYSTIQADLRRKGKHDPGAGSTLAVLERRGLVLVVHDEVFVPLVGMVPRIRVRLSTAGRAAVRAGQGTTAPARPPRGLMTEWLWGILARLYPAGEEGLPWDTPHGTPLAERGSSWNALLGLRDRRDGPYMEEFRARTGELVTPAGTQHQTYQTEWRMRITDAGRQHYETHYACYRELHPAIEAAEPVSRPSGAHAGLADHRKRRPAGLAPEQQWRILAKLAELEQSGTCFLRTLLTDRYEAAHREIPDAIATMPCGLLRWQVEKVTRSTTALDRLLAARLIEAQDIPNLRWTADDQETIPLFCLTHTGRAHYAEHRAAYRELYPDVRAPQPADQTA